MSNLDTMVYLLFPAGTRVVRRNGTRMSSLPLAHLTPNELAALHAVHPLNVVDEPAGLTYERRQPIGHGELGSHMVTVKRIVTTDKQEAMTHQQAGGIVISQATSLNLV